MALHLANPSSLLPVTPDPPGAVSDGSHCGLSYSFLLPVDIGQAYFLMQQFLLIKY